MIMTGNEFRAVRMRLNLTQQEYADALGVGLRSVVRWEAAPETPIAASVARAATALEPPPAVLPDMSRWDEIAARRAARIAAAQRAAGVDLSSLVGDDDGLCWSAARHGGERACVCLLIADHEGLHRCEEHGREWSGDIGDPGQPGAQPLP